MAHKVGTRVIVLPHDYYEHGIDSYTITISDGFTEDEGGGGNFDGWYSADLGADNWGETSGEINHYLEAYDFVYAGVKFPDAPLGYKVKPIKIGRKMYYV